MSDRSTLPRAAAGEACSFACDHGPGPQGADDDHDSCADSPYRPTCGPRVASRALPGHPAQDSCSRRPSLLVLIFVYGFNLWTFFLSFTNSKAFTIYHAHRPRQLPEALELDLRDRSAVELVHGDRQHGHFRRALYRLLPRPRPDARDPARPEDPRRGHPAADLSLSAGAVVHRHRHGVEAVSRSGHRPREGGARSGAGRASTSTGSSIRA